MKIRTKISFIVVVAGIAIFLFGSALIFSYQTMIKSQDSGDKVRRIRNSIMEINFLVYSFLSYQDEQSEKNILSEIDKLQTLIVDTRLKNEDEKRLLDEIIMNNQAMKEDVLRLISQVNILIQGAMKLISKETEGRIVAQILKKSHKADSLASNLRRMVDEDIRKTQKRIITIVFLLMGLIATPVIIMLTQLGRRLSADLINLHQATEVISSGNLDYLVPIDRDDEIGDLTRAFNRMTLNLQEITASKADLEKEIAERKQAEDRLRQNEARYRELVQNANNAIIRWTCDGFISFFNEYAQTFFGYSAEEILGRHVSILIPEVDSTGGDLTRLIQGILDHPDRHVQNINENICRNGQRVWMAWTNKPIFDEHGRVKEILAIGMDVTKRKRMEGELEAHRQLLETVVNHMPAAVNIIRGNDLRLQMVNPAYQSFAPGKEMVGRTLEEIWPETGQSFSTLCHRVIETGEPYQVQDELNMIHRYPDGPLEPAYFSWSLHRVNLPGQEGWGLLNTAWETTERKKMEEALRKSHMELEKRVQARTAELSAMVAKLKQLNQELQEFAFIASHDLQEPLRKIETFSDLIKKSSASLLDQQGKDYLERVLRSANRMRQLLRDLLKFSRVATRSEPFVKVDLVKITREAADVFEAVLQETGGRIEIDNLPGIEADESQMLQLFQNLISNALKFRGSKAPFIRISGQEFDGRLGEILVKDNGIGFDMQFAKGIFKPFERLHGRSEYEGTGMGLAICRKIVERHGGTIRAESQPGLGSSFIIRLPLRQTEGKGQS
jgi:PAS domain S-box-containing protein